MKKMMVILGTLLSVGLLSDAADAKRVGGGSSVGKQRTITQPAAKPPAEAVAAREEVVEPPKPAAPVAVAPPPAPAPEPAKPVAPPPAADADRARALLEGKPATAPAVAAAAATPAAAAERLVVQVGAFAEEARAREVRQKLEGAGLKTYTHVAQTADGKRIRVRVGPFETRADADKAAARVKALGLPAAVLTL